LFALPLKFDAGNCFVLLGFGLLCFCWILESSSSSQSRVWHSAFRISANCQLHLNQHPFFEPFLGAIWFDCMGGKNAHARTHRNLKPPPPPRTCKDEEEEEKKVFSILLFALFPLFVLFRATRRAHSLTENNKSAGKLLLLRLLVKSRASNWSPTIAACLLLSYSPHLAHYGGLGIGGKEEI
jgi:hypothetical protein